MDTRTPAQGGSQTTLFTPYTGVLSDNVSIGMNAGFSFFKVMCIGTPMGTPIFGMYDVSVKQIIDQINISNAPNFDVNWMKGAGFEKGYVRLEWDKKSNRSFGYIVDDPAWKNRLNLYGLRESKKFLVAQYLTPKGLIDGAVMTEQIKFIGDQLNDYVVTSFHETLGSEELYRGKDLQEAKALEASLKRKDKNKRCQVVTMPTIAIQELIVKYGPLWMEKEEFVKGIRASLESEIEEKFVMVPQIHQEEIKDPKAIVTEAFSMLTPQERLEILQGMAGSSVTIERPEIIPKKLEPMAIPADKVLDNMAMPELKVLADDHDVFMQGMQREDVIKELKLKRAPKTQQKTAAKEEMIT
jgi:hypothetical protein